MSFSQRVQNVERGKYSMKIQKSVRNVQTSQDRMKRKPNADMTNAGMIPK